MNNTDTPIGLAHLAEEDLAHIRHELRTPLNAIVGYSEMLLEEAEEQGQGRIAPDLARIHAAGKRLLTLINELLASGSRPATESAVVSATAPAALPSSEKETGRETARLLIVDDNAQNRDVLVRRLHKQGFAVTEADDGKQALERLREADYDLVLLDVMMPEMDGFEALALMKADETLVHIPVIMLSASSELQSVVRCIQIGAEDYLPKPFEPTLLQARIGACLEKKRLRDQEREYLRNVGLVTLAAAEVEEGAFQPETLSEVTARTDELGRLARVFEKMAQEVHAREQRLKQQVQRLRIEVDEAKRQRQVAEITETDYFQSLQQRANALRARERTVSEPASQKEP